MKQFIFAHKKAALIAGFVLTLLLGGMGGVALERMHAGYRFERYELTDRRMEERKKERGRFDKKDREEDTESGSTSKKKTSEENGSSEKQSSETDTSAEKDSV